MYIKIKRKPTIILAACICAFAITLGILLNSGTNIDAQSAAVGTAGSANDPIVTASYVSRYVREAVDAAVSEALANLPNHNNQFGQSNNQHQTIIQCDCDHGHGHDTKGYEIIRLTQNQRIHSASGTAEIILRPGAVATVISGNWDLGIADITTGQELLRGDFAPINHLLIIPRADTRGLVIHSEVAYALVRGDILISD